MASKKSRAMQRMPKMEPSELNLRFSTLNFNGARTFYVDLSQVASIVNRRFYRQGLNWAVGGFKILSPDPSTTGSVTISKLPNTWVMSNSWEKSFRVWQRMNNEALAENPSVRPRFLDFKIYADAEHHASGFGTNLLPNSLSTTALPGEWDPSKAVITADGNPNLGTSLEFIATGASYPGLGATGFNAVSLIEGYAASRGLPNIAEPNTPGDLVDASGTTPENWMTAIFNEGTIQDSAVLDDLQNENNVAPYPFEGDGANFDTMYPGGANQMPGLQIHDEALITTTTVGGITYLKGGNFPCGLIRFDLYRTAAETGNYLIQIEMIPGMHRGYLAESMTEM